MVCMFHCANCLEMQLNDIIIVSVMVSDAYTITDTNLILPKMADTDISIWYWCIPNGHAFLFYNAIQSSEFTSDRLGRLQKRSIVYISLHAANYSYISMI